MLADFIFSTQACLALKLLYFNRHGLRFFGKFKLNNRRLDKIKPHRLNSFVDSHFVVRLDKRGKLPSVQFVDERIRNTKRVISHSVHFEIILLEKERAARSNDKATISDGFSNACVQVCDCLLTNLSLLKMIENMNA